MKKVLYVASAVLIGVAVKLRLKNDTDRRPPIDLEPELPQNHTAHLDEKDSSEDSSDEDTDGTDDGMVECIDDDCEKEFETERGMKIHHGIVHKD